MFNIHNKEAIETIREWLDEISYSTLNYRIMQSLDQTGQLYPDFYNFMGSIDRINPLYAFIFSIFRLGQPTEHPFLKTFISVKVIDAFVETGLLVKEGCNYRMPEIGILPLRGMYYVAPLPGTYPTVSRNCRFEPVNQYAQLMMDEVASQSAGTDFIEIHADFGMLANVAAARGFKNIRIRPKHTDYIPFIQLNLLLNSHEGEVITYNDSKKYDLIVGVNLSVNEKIGNRNPVFSDEYDVIKLFSMFNQLKKKGQSILLLESLGSIAEIIVNERLKKTDGLNIKSVVLDKVPYQVFLLACYIQSSWEKQFELFPYDYVDYAKKTIESSEGKEFVFTQLLKINKQKTDEPFVLFPFYNPKYSDPVYNYASLTM